MIGAIAGDVAGSIHEGSPRKSKDFELFGARHRFTDDTVLTVAVAEWILDGSDLVDTLHDYVHRYPRAGYGGTFLNWALTRDRKPYGSWGNGSAMRVSPVAYAFDSMEPVLAAAERSAAVTHDHPEGIRGAQATAAAVFLARTGADKPAIRRFVESRFGYDLSTPLDAIRAAHTFDVSCQGSVPPALVSFLEANDFEDALRNAISLGGDADTMACIAGAVAGAHFGVPAAIERETLTRLDPPLAAVVARFRERFGPRVGDEVVG